MSEYHTRLKAEIRQIKLDTIALKRINKEMKEDEYMFDEYIDMQIDRMRGHD